MDILFGIDIGGTTVKMGVLDLEGNIISKWEIVTRKEENGKLILPDIAASMMQYINNEGIDVANIKGIGFGVPGPVRNNVVQFCVNLGWGCVDVPQEFERLIPFKTKIVAANDANVAAYGELKKGQKDLDSAIMYTLGTGVGGGIIANGRPVDGHHGAAGEFGHLKLDHKYNFRCNCGRYGCLETIASATGIINITKKKIADGGKTILSVDNLNGKTIVDAAEQGDKLALEVVDEAADALGLAASIAAATVDPKCFIFGGGLSKAGPFLLNKIINAYKSYVFNPLTEIPFYLAILGNDSGMVGAALLSQA